MKSLPSIFLIIIVSVLSQACGSTAYVRGDYDDDVKSDNLLSDKWSETDMQKIVGDLVGKMIRHRAISEAKGRPVVMVTSLKNKTHEHIDTQNIMDMVRVELSNSGRVAFVDKEARGDVADEYKYQGSGMVSAETKKGPGGQIGADYIINGRLDTIVQEDGTRKTVYYKVTLNLTNLRTNLIEWTGYKQLRKKYRKQRVSI